MMMMCSTTLACVFLLATCAAISGAGAANNNNDNRSGRNVVKINDQVALEVIAEDIFRIFRCNNGCTDAAQQLQQRTSLVVLDEARQAHVDYTVSMDGNDLMIINTTRMFARPSISTGVIEFHNPDGSMLVKEGSSSFGSDGGVYQDWPLLDPYEAIYGGGQYVNGHLNYRSGPISLAQFNTEAAIPFVVSTHGYGILWDLYGETLMNPPQRQIKLDSNFQGTFTPTDNGPVWFYMVACGPSNPVFGCGKEPINVTLTDPTDGSSSSRIICEHSLANLPKSVACRVNGLQQGITYTLTYQGQYSDRQLFVTSVATHNRLAFQTPHAGPDNVIDYYLIASSASSENSKDASASSFANTAKVAGSSSTTISSSLEGVLQNYRKLTGTANLYPKWVYGFWHCKEHYHNQTELLSAASRFRQLQIPMDSIVQDWRYWGDLGWGPQYDPKIYPTPKEMIDTLHAQNLHFMISVWSKFDEKTRFYKEMSKAGVIINASTYMDAWNPTAQQMFYNYVQDTHFSIGADALWLDATEPENPDEKGQDVYLGKGDDYANTYSLMVTQTVHKGLVQNYPNRRVFALTRSSFAGQQRFGAALWSGDTTGSWDSLRRQIAMSINYQLSGMPYWSMDTGGFFRPIDQYTNPDYHTLLIRWFQFAVFTPIFRVHGSHSDTELWNYGKQVQDTIVQTAIRFRYRLLEYIYSGFYQVETKHSTMQRGLILDFEHDLKVRDIADQFMFGPSFLVAPIYQPNSSRSIYLPKFKGSKKKWRCFYSGNELLEGRTLQFDNVTITRIPLFVQSSILVLGPDGRQHVDDDSIANNNKLEVRVYDGADSQFELFDDDGISSDPNRPTTTIVVRWQEQTRTLTIGEAVGDGTFKARTMDIVLVRPGVGVGIDPTTQPDATITYNGTAVSVELPSFVAAAESSTTA